jgi:hypothetical protein
MCGLAHVFIFYDANKFGVESLFEILCDLRVFIEVSIHTQHKVKMIQFNVFVIT